MSTKAAGLGDAIAKGVTGYYQGRTDRQEAKVRKARGEAELRKLGAEKETGAVEAQVQALAEQNKKLIATTQRDATYRAFDLYTEDFDPRHLNNFIHSDVMKGKFPNMVSVDKIDAFNDQTLIRKHGFDPMVFRQDETKENASGRFLKATMKDGSKKMIDMMTLYAGTGYTRQVDNRKLERLLLESKIAKAMQGKEVTPTALERNARLVAKAEERIKKAEAEGKEPNPEDVQISKFGMKEKAGIRPGQLGAAEDRTEDLLNKFGGEKQFFETDFGDPENFRKAYSDVAAIERLENVQFTSKEKTDLNSIRMLISMGDPGKNLTESETGLYDTTFMQAKKYLSDEVEGVAARSAYAAFRNTVRHALFGSALTEAEIKSFQEAFGGLGQKLGPVLQQFKTALVQVQAKLESVGRMKNPYSAHVRLGVDEMKMDQILSSLQDRIDMMSQLDVGPRAKQPTKEDLKGFGGTK